MNPIHIIIIITSACLRVLHELFFSFLFPPSLSG